MEKTIRDNGPKKRSVMIVSDRDAFTQCMSEIFPSDDDNVVTNQGASFTSMNGHAAELAFEHDVVIFEADPDDEGEVNAIQEVLSQRAGHTVFLALANSDISIAKARQLRDIGVDEVLPMSITGNGIRDVINEKLGARHRTGVQISDGYSAQGKLIAITQARGGVGATTIAVNLACSLVGQSSLFRKSEKHRVALLDFDLQFGNANVFLDMEDNGGFLQLIEATETPDEHFLGGVLQTHVSGVDVLCAPMPIAPLQSVRPDVIENTLDILQQKYDYVIVDFPRALVDWIEPVLSHASQLVVVTDTTVPSVRQARRLIDFYREENVGLPVEVIVNREKRPLIKTEHIREAEKVLKTRLSSWLPDNPKLAREAADLGKPVVALKPRSDLGRALSKLAAQMAADPQKAQRLEA